jgi:HEPN domain-containing protein
MRPLEDPEVARWLDAAAADREAATALAELNRPELWRVVCFHCQQEAEKLLKATLVRCEHAPPKTHNLLRLLDLVQPHLDMPDDSAEAATALTPHAVLSRSPTRFAPTEVDGREAMDHATQLRHALLEADAEEER